VTEPLVCPSCDGAYGSEERFCPRCHLPLVPVGTGVEHLSPRQEQARKVKRQYSEGGLVRVVGARHQAEAEFIQGLLLEEGIPSMLRRSMGFDVPDFLAAGPRDVLVPRSGAAAARDVLLQAELLPSGRAGPAPMRVLAWMLVVVAVLVLLAWAGIALRG
jgi:hypothetical protein